MLIGRVLAIDIETSSTKAAIFSESGAIEVEADAKHPTQTPGPGRQEQHALDWWQSTVAAIRKLGDLAGVGAIGLSGTMQNVIPMGTKGELLGPAILYSDSRATAQFAEFGPSLIASGMPAIIGNRPNEFMAAFKIRWLFDEQAEQYGRTHVIHFSPKDYVIYRLTGRHVTDPTTATTVGLMNLASRCWDSASLRQFGISEKLLPTIEPSRAVIGRIGDVAARQLGLAAGVPVVNGLGDAGASTVGAGMTEVGQAYIHLGTTAWVAGMSDLAAAPLPRRTFALPHAEPGKLIEIAPTLSGGDCIAWLRGVLGIEIDALSAPIAAVDARPSDVMFLPYLNGERSPFVDASVRGGFVMLGRSDGAAEMLYAVLEGVAFSLRENMDLLDVKTDTVRLIGGGGGSDVWPQLIADAVGRVVEVADKSNIVPAFGAYCEAVRAFDGVPGELRFGRRFLPRPERLERNGRRHNLFRSATAFVRTLPRQ